MECVEGFVMTYKTAQIAKIIGIHPNTVRLYEKLELISTPKRLANGYRMFTDLHIEQCRLIRLAFQVEVLQNGLRKKITEMVKATAKCDFDGAIAIANDYLGQVTAVCRFRSCCAKCWFIRL